MIYPPHQEQMRKALDELRPNPNPRIVALLEYAIDEILPKLSTEFYKEHSGKWVEWARGWRAGDRSCRSPQACVNISHWCTDHKGWGLDGNSTDPVSHALGQLAWGAKEACYSAPTSGWLVIRYIADAMVAFGIAFPDEGMPLLNSPMLEGELELAKLRRVANT